MLSLRDLNAIAATMRGVPVWACLPGSPAARAGVRSGDVILEVNGMRTVTIDDYVTAQERDTAKMELVVFREGAEVRLSLEYDAVPADPEAVARTIVEQKLLPGARTKKPERGNA